MLPLCSIFSMLAALFIWEAGHHGNSMCAVSVQGTPPLVFTQRHLLLWDLTGQKHEMQIVLTELPIIINPWFVTQLLMGLTEKQLSTWTKTAALLQFCERGWVLTVVDCQVFEDQHFQIYIKNTVTLNESWQCWMHRLCERVRGSRAQMEGCGFVAVTLAHTPSTDHCFIILCSVLKVRKGRLNYESDSSLTGKCTAAAAA